MTDSDPPFEIPARPERRFPVDGGVRYEGAVVLHLTPDDERTGSLASLVEATLDDERYTVGDWFDLPEPVYLVRDRTLRTAFRVVVRRGRVEVHVLPETKSAGLRTFYDRLVDDDTAWTTNWYVDDELADGNTE